MPSIPVAGAADLPLQFVRLGCPDCPAGTGQWLVWHPSHSLIVVRCSRCHADWMALAVQPGSPQTEFVVQPGQVI